MRSLVTGGAGFIGSHLADALVARGDEVHIIDNLSTGFLHNVPRMAKLHIADICFPDRVFREVQPEAVYHLAAQADVRKSLRRPAKDATTNLIGTIRILEAAREADAKIVFASSGGAGYGESVEPAVETDVLAPLSPYGTAKLCAEQYIATWARLYGTQHVSLRFANVYGPRQDPSGEAGVAMIFMNLIKQGRPVTIFGDGSQVRDYIHVSDVVDAVIKAMDATGPVYNVGTGTGTTLNGLYDEISRITGNTLPPAYAPPRLGELHTCILNPALARDELAWKPQHTLAAGLQDTWNSLPPR